MFKPNGVILFEGPSTIDQKPIVAILTGINLKSANIKTGEMLQTYIIRSDMNPVEALYTGDDASICGDCKHRPSLVTHNGEARCYVNVGQGVNEVYKAYKRGNYPKVSKAEIAKIIKGRNVRFGAYGDPCAVPIEVFEHLAKHCNKYTGYTHRWRDHNFNKKWTTMIMASVDNIWEQQTALALGMRYFRVQIGYEKPLPGEISCPASKEGGKVTTCNQCALCAGTSRQAKNIVIADHGLGYQKRILINNLKPTI